MGLVQLLKDWPCREFPCPDILARHLLELALDDFRETGHHYLMCLVAQRDRARRRGAIEEVTGLDGQIHEHAIHEQIPRRWCLDFLFSRNAYVAYGDGLLAVWASVLIEICVLEQHWEGALLGLPSRNPYLLPGFHADKDVYDTAWMQDARRTWLEELHAVPPATAEPDEAKEELNNVYLEREAEPDGTERGPWVH